MQRLRFIIIRFPYRYKNNDVERFSFFIYEMRIS